jgi:serine/threonine-protein kinase
MGVVWAARDRTTDARVAIKLLLDEGSSEDKAAHESLRKELVQRLKREAEACMKLAHHPNVVRVLKFSMDGTEPCGPYMVMEQLEGESLQEHLKRKRILEPKLAARIAADVASCLSAAHTAKLIHRDLKPANIYLHREPGMYDGEFVTKVLDFGVCKDGDAVEVASDNAATMTGMILGSIAYMSPQQAMGSKHVDFRTDIWSVGVVLYEMLTGLRAFSGQVNDILKLYAPIILGKSTTPPVPAPSSRMRNIPPELDTVVERCTKPKPTDRYASAAELARDLYTVAGLPMPVIPSAKPSSSGKSPIEVADLIDVYAPAIMESNAVPQAQDPRRFSEFARTVPLKGGFGPKQAPPVIVEEIEENRPIFNVKSTLPMIAPSAVLPVNLPDSSDVDVTIRMPSKGAVAVASRPPVLNEPPADADVRTQFLPADAAIASPMPDLSEMQRALHEHRKSYASISIEDIPELNVAGDTRLLKAEDILQGIRVDPGVTTSALMSQSIAELGARSIPFDPAGTTNRRRNRNRGLLVLVAGAVSAALGLMIFVIVKSREPVAPPLKETPELNLPHALVSIDAPVEMPPAPSAKAEPEKVPLAPSAAPSGGAVPTTLPSSSPPVSKPPSVPPPRPKPPPAPPPPPPPPPPIKCTGAGIFKKCNGKSVVKSTLNPTAPF